jgi:DNA-binding transcriptional LysR family regulator
MTLGFDDIAVFVKVAREGSFIGAARALAMPTSTVSRPVAALEARLKVQLLRRTTRAISLTDDGLAFAARCGVAFDEIEAASAVLAETGETLRGTLRVAAPPFAGPEMLGPCLLKFAQAYLDMTLDLRIINTTPDLVEDGIDLAFQIGPLRDGRYKARKLWPVPYMLCASRDLVEGRPDLLKMTHPSQLTAQPCVLTPPMRTWMFERQDGSEFSFTPKTVGASIEGPGAWRGSGPARLRCWLPS